MNTPEKTTTAQLQAWDKQYVWHPFTQMQDWLADDPIVIVAGEGSWLIDSDGNRYLDGVASLWTNVHGHSHPALNKALADQAARLEHSTLLGLANEQSILLAKRLIEIAPAGLSKVFYSDNGSTAVEVGLKMAYQYHCHQGEPQRSRFLRLQHAYHGDTIGSMSVGGISIYHDTFKPLLFSTIEAPAPYCYRCPMGQSDPAACGMACLGALEQLMREHREQLAGMLMEPLLQGAGGMLVHPAGYLKGVRELCDRYGVLLITDEVATGFGRTGSMFACQQEGVAPDIMAISKGLCAGYLPLAATLATEEIYQAFLGNYAELKTFFHGHTFTGNPLACAVALRSLELFEETALLESVGQRSKQLTALLQQLEDHPHVGNLRQCGLAAGIELVQDKATKAAYPWEEKRGVKVCLEARRHGVFSRPLGNTVVVFPPLAITADELAFLLDGLQKAIRAVTD
ncbi:adenosylmethionine--8-amino-7-oxononanoate transaminase [Trichlorobacter lovleyi]|uniref:adenosylmethionine--8-amino-7-oxononanoate transaminase n=1 Tax=Trichlorobacter lovleyi TaxID=313985 RepID=UPI00223EEC53|nr:adenosylmethionine--8-amino-7-oxononanoate transaminase [Trichlorobacter lovleyi]QOX79290.1 adenosylmethionine--8-amino-7-oxononanoate transaminase [Trichlorobacter lovleyi]